VRGISYGDLNAYLYRPHSVLPANALKILGTRSRAKNLLLNAIRGREPRDGDVWIFSPAPMPVTIASARLNMVS
jgi:hypothetical protein